MSKQDPPFPAEPPLDPGSKSILVVGGTFDPPHRAHINLSVEVADQINCDHILFIPVNQSPHKQGKQTTPGEHRYAMTKLAVQKIPNTSVSRYELDRSPPSYTVNTLEELHRAINPKTIRLLLGSDQAKSFTRWHQWERLLELATPAVVLRPPDKTPTDLIESGLDNRWLNWTIPTPLDPVSSTGIRRKLTVGNRSQVQDSLNENVLDYIVRHNLYTSAHAE